MAGKIAAKYVYAPKLTAGTTVIEPSLIWNAVADMTPDQFATYDAALRERDYYTLSPAEQQNYTVAIQAANQRRQQEGLSPDRAGFNVTIRDGNRASVLPSLPFGLQWTPLLAAAGVLVIVALMGRR